MTGYCHIDPNTPHQGNKKHYQVCDANHIPRSLCPSCKLYEDKK